MKIIILSNSYSAPREIEINQQFWMKLVFVVFFFFFIYQFLISAPKNSLISPEELAKESFIRDQVDLKLDEIQSRLDNASTKLASLSSQGGNFDPLMPKVVELALQQKQADQIGGPLILSNKSLDSESSEVRFDQILRQINDFEYQVSQAENALHRANTENQSIPLRPPLQDQYSVSSPYGYRIDPFTKSLSLHEGVDLTATVNSNILATADGIVTQAGRVDGYGLMVEIKHANGFITRYGHANKLLVHIGDEVKVGQAIGLVGNTGRSTGNHLHYEILYGGQTVDPQRVIGLN
jgi:murein DD-endopeptidase MepM/ murein hydrolase activator NlpD